MFPNSSKTAELKESKILSFLVVRTPKFCSGTATSLNLMDFVFVGKHQGKSKILSTISEMASEELAKQQSYLFTDKHTTIERQANA